jgi:transcriptional regulator with XRE-family HTH domain
MSRAKSTILAEFLKSRRSQVGLSQKDVAKSLGYSTSQFVSNWERGISQPPVSVLRRLADLYKIDAEEMFKVLLETTVSQVEVDLKKKFYSKAVSA